MQKLQDSLNGLLSRTDLGEYKKEKQYMQLQNKYLTLKLQLNSSSTVSSIPHSEERIGISSSLLADNVPTAMQRPAAVTVTPVQEPTCVQLATVKTPVKGPLFKHQ